ncbi:MAG: Gfo/Idh/MocA family oxidoreductase [Planctomycetales bacterium]|nr:Gfo/Idh/MocA family oxidoreductase [Planctomycetales bacterium]
MASSELLLRRQFLRTTAAAGVAAPALFSAVAASAQPVAANDRLTLGFIGIGMMGRGHLSRFLGMNDVQVLAVCDVEKTRRENARQAVEARYAEAKKSGAYRGCDEYTDFRELLARKDIDAVLIATPDHWHAIPCIQAAKSGKHIYCEKPLTFTIREGRMIADAVRDAKVIFQTGSQQRSEFGGKFRQAADLIRNGRIGKVKTVRVGVGGPPKPCDLPELEAPGDVDWQMWVGPSVYRGYNEILCPRGMHKHFPAFRQYREYAGGSLADMGAHHFDIAQWALGMDASGPIKVEPPADGAETGLKFTYRDGVEMFHGGPSGCTFEGTEGTLYVDRGALTASSAEILETPLPDNAERVYLSTDHSRNWIECIRGGKATICPPEVGHRSATICHLANIGYRLGRALNWDPQAEQFDDKEANALLHREPRDPWSYSV